MATYILMNKNTPVLSFEYDTDIHAAYKIIECFDLKYAPPVILDMKGNVTKKSLNDWWRGRAIPASRNHIQALLDSLSIESTLELAEKNFGLSLSDRYWINDPKNPQKWADINFFDNDFSDDLGLLTLGQDMSVDPNLMSPNSTLGGDLNKKWKCFNGKRVLLKAGTGLTQQEVFNELIATRLYQRILNDGDYVPYTLIEEGGTVFSACENMLKEDEELVTAYDVIANRRKSNSMNDYQFLVSCYKELGLSNIEQTLEKMFTCDYLLANEDRHWRNFGVIRNVETLEYTRIAPIFDSGTSLWCRSFMLDLHSSYIAKPFGSKGMSPERQLNLFSGFEWLDCLKLNGFAEDVREILSSNSNISEKRINMIVKKVEKNISAVQNKVSHLEREHLTQTYTLDSKAEEIEKTIQQCKQPQQVINKTTEERA